MFRSGGTSVVEYTPRGSQPVTATHSVPPEVRRSIWQARRGSLGCDHVSATALGAPAGVRSTDSQTGGAGDGNSALPRNIREGSLRLPPVSVATIQKHHSPISFRAR